MSAAPEPPLYLDCCVTLNLYATRRFVEIVTANSEYRIRVSEAVALREARYVGRADERELVDLEPALQSGVIALERIESDNEAATFVTLATTLGDGEAESGALAYHRRGAVATDDGLAIRELGRLSPAVPVLRTSELMKRWAEHGSGQPVDVVRDALNAINERARFVPSAEDPFAEWWMRMAA